jgi:hypothetical protein
MTNGAKGKSSPSTEAPAGKSGSPHPEEEFFGADEAFLASGFDLHLSSMAG